MQQYQPIYCDAEGPREHEKIDKTHSIWHNNNTKFVTMQNTCDLVYMWPRILLQRQYNGAIGIAVVDENFQRCRFGPPQGRQNWCAVLEFTKSETLRTHSTLMQKLNGGANETPAVGAHREVDLIRRNLHRQN